MGSGLKRLMCKNVFIEYLELYSDGIGKLDPRFFNRPKTSHTMKANDRPAIFEMFYIGSF